MCQRREAWKISGEYISAAEAVINFAASDVIAIKPDMDAEQRECSDQEDNGRCDETVSEKCRRDHEHLKSGEAFYWQYFMFAEGS